LRIERFLAEVGAMRAFRELKVWSKAHALTVAVFLATRSIRRGEFPGLVSQVRRAAASIPTNIAEGCGHATEREFARFLQMALASASELEYHLLLGLDLGMLSRRDYHALDAGVTEVKRMLTSLIHHVRVRARSEKSERTPADPLTADA
jgi:four helix bundle protein